jgi:hypothetical protein
VSYATRDQRAAGSLDPGAAGREPRGQPNDVIGRRARFCTTEQRDHRGAAGELGGDPQA